MSYKRNQTRYSKKKKIKISNRKKLDELTKKYGEYPDKFVEELWGVKLYDYQKIILRLLNKKLK